MRDLHTSSWEELLATDVADETVEPFSQAALFLSHTTGRVMRSTLLLLRSSALYAI